jgi:hypothetical protein
MPTTVNVFDAALLMALAALLGVVLPFLARGLEARYQSSRGRADDRIKQGALEQSAREHVAEREQSSIELATQLLERYSTRLEQAYDRERARREASDEEVARLRIEVAALRVVVGELNNKLAQFMGVSAAPIPIPPAPTPPPSTATPAEKREAEVGPKPDLVAIGVKAANGEQARKKEGV